MEPELIQLASQVGQVLSARRMTVGTAESCTGGLMAHALTAISGASSYFLGGIVAYSNPVKADLLDVKPETLEKFGAVSKETAGEMALGVRKRIRADLGLSTTGIAGPLGGTAAKPVGLVYCGISADAFSQTFRFQFSADRIGNQYQTVVALLTELLVHLQAA